MTIPELDEAWQRVADNQGCAGVDGVEIEDFRKRAERELKGLREQVEAGEYRALPLRKIVVEKSPGSGKMRRLLVPAVRDRVLQTAVARRLSRSFEEEFLESSYAYRPGRGVDRAVARVIQLRDRGFDHVVDADIRSFFDQVAHAPLLERLARQEADEGMLALVRDWVRAEFWDGQRVRRVRRGIAQGSPLSPLLANFFLQEFDRELEKSGNHLVRYADDFLILCRSAEAAQGALAQTAGLLEALDLRLNQEKSRVTRFAEGFTFLGVYFFGNRAWIPWKDGGRAQGNVLFSARPMPENWLVRYRTPAPRTEMELAFREYGRTTVEPGAAGPRARTGADGEGGKPVAYLYITEQGSVVRKSGERYLVEAGDRIVLDLPYHKLESVLLFGRVQITTQAMTELLDKGIQVSLFSRQGRYRGALTPARGKQVDLRLKQFELYREEGRWLAFARATIRAKLANGREVLERYAARARGGEAAAPGQANPEGGDSRARDGVGGNADPALAERLAVIDHAIRQAAEAPDLATLLGLEGAATRAYFDAVMAYNRSGFAWNGRRKRPAPDPLNAPLSLTYTLIGREAAGAAEGLGLDPHVGFLHRLDYGRPSLALDLLEPLRHPVADRFVLTTVNRGVFGEKDFHEGTPHAGRTLTLEGLREFLGHYERWMLAPSAGGRSFREAIREEARHFAAAVAGRCGWDPFEWKRHENGREACSTSSVTT